MKKISPLFLLALSMSCTTPGMQQGLDKDLDAEKFEDKLNSHEVAFAQAIYQNDAQQAAAIAHSASTSIDIDKYIDLRRFYSNSNKRFSFLLLAAFQDCPAIVELILANTWGASNKQGSEVINQTTSSARTALHLAAERGYGAVVDILLAKGAAVDATTRKGETPLHLALDSTYVAIAKELVARGAINVETSEGKTPLHLAAERGYREVVDTLLAKNAAVDATTSEGKTPLHLAAERNFVAIAEVLLAPGAAVVHAKTTAGKTPLHLAAENNGQEAVSYLLNNQANPQATDHQDRTPLALARSAHHEAIVKILERHEKKSCRRSCIDWAAACDRDHCPNGPGCGAFGFTLDCACFQNPCGFACKTLCCAWSCCCPLEEVQSHPPAAVPPTPASSSAPTAPLPGSAPMQR